MVKKCKPGYVSKDNKCVKRNLNPATWFSAKKKKSYNPFKMWGSYVGSLIGWMTLWFGNNEYFNFWYLKVWQILFKLPAFDYSAILLTIIFGFLLGWGIHSIIRKIKR